MMRYLRESSSLRRQYEVSMNLDPLTWVTWIKWNPPLLIFLFIRGGGEVWEPQRPHPALWLIWSSVQSGKYSEQWEQWGAVGSWGEQYLQSNITTLFTPRCLQQDFTNNKSSRLTSRHIILHNQDIDVSVKGGHPQLLNGTYLTQKTLVTWWMVFNIAWTMSI